MKTSEETKLKISIKLKQKWASGTRKKNNPEMYKITSAKQKELYATGKRIPHLTVDDCRKGGLTVTEKKLLTNKRIGLEKIGVNNAGERNSANENHWKAIFWVLKSPDKIEISGKNLNNLIRENSSLFNKDDLNWVRGQCRASKGLRKLFELTPKGDPRTHSWKGWMIGDKWKELNAK